VELDEEKFNKLVDVVRSVKTQEDFDKVISIVKEIEKDVEREYELRIEEFVRSFINIDVVQEKLRSLKDEEVKKELIEYLKEKVDDFLTDP
jgi:anaerobic ribonucleoside-triphosphate reductase